MNTSRILTGGGFVKIPLNITERNGEKVRLYHLKNLTQEKIEKARSALLHEIKRQKDYQGDVKVFEKEIKEKNYLLREGKTLQLTKGEERSTPSGVIIHLHHIKIIQKSNFEFGKGVNIGGDFNINGDNAHIVFHLPEVSHSSNKQKSIEELSRHLVGFYKEQETEVYKAKEKGRWERSFPIEGVYTSLAILTEEERITKKQEAEHVCRDGRIPTFEFIYKAKKPVSLQEIFKQNKIKDTSNKRAVIFGVAGVGKTTFCKMIAAKAIEFWPEFKIVFLVELRNLKAGQNPYQALAEECGFELKDYQNLLEDREFRGKCLLILDGYDELCRGLEGKNGIFRKFDKLFDHILLTSRPTSVDIDYVIEIEIIGFDNESILLYIDKFYNALTDYGELSHEGAKEKTLKLKQIIAKKTVLLSLAQTPINLSLICTIFKEDEAFINNDNNFTMTSFYIEVVNWYYKWYQLRLGTSTLTERAIRDQKNPRLDYKTDCIATALEEIAYEAMLNDTIYPRQDKIESILKKKQLTLDNVKDIGILSIENGVGQFIHLTFQEYLAATYLASFYIDGTREKGTELLQKIKFKPHYLITLIMTAGYISRQGQKEHLQAFFDDLFGEPYDLAESYELNLLARSFEECEKPRQTRQYTFLIDRVANYLKNACIGKVQFKMLNRNARLLHEEAVISTILRSLLGKEERRSEVLIALTSLVRGGQMLPKEIINALISLIGSQGLDNTTFHNIVAILSEIPKREELPSKKLQETLLHLIGNMQFLFYSMGLASLEKMLKELTDNKEEWIEVFPGCRMIANPKFEPAEEFENSFFTKLLQHQAIYTIAFLEEFQAENLAAPFIENWVKIIKNPTYNSKLRIRAAYKIVELSRGKGDFARKNLRLLEQIAKDLSLDYTTRKIATASLMMATSYNLNKSLIESIKTLKDLVGENIYIQFLIRVLQNSDLELSLRQTAISELIAVSLEKGVDNRLDSLINIITDSKADAIARDGAGTIIIKNYERNKSISKEVSRKIINIIGNFDFSIESRLSANYILKHIGTEEQKKITSIILEIEKRALLSEEVMFLIETIKNPKFTWESRGWSAFILGEVLTKANSLVVPKEFIENLISIIKNSKINKEDRGKTAYALVQIMNIKGEEIKKKSLSALFEIVVSSNFDGPARELAAFVIVETTGEDEDFEKKYREELVRYALNPNLKEFNQDHETYIRYDWRSSESFIRMGSIKALNAIAEKEGALAEKVVELLLIMFKSPAYRHFTQIKSKRFSCNNAQEYIAKALIKIAKTRQCTAKNIVSCFLEVCGPNYNIMDGGPRIAINALIKLANEGVVLELIVLKHFLTNLGKLSSILSHGLDVFRAIEKIMWAMETSDLSVQPTLKAAYLSQVAFSYSENTNNLFLIGHRKEKKYLLEDKIKDLENSSIPNVRNWRQAQTNNNLKAFKEKMKAGLEFRKNGDNERAVKCFETAAQIYYHLSDIIDLKEAGLLFHVLGNSCISIKKYDEATRYLLKSLSIKQEVYKEPHLEIAKTLNSLGTLSVKKREKDFNRAYFYLKQALAQSEKLASAANLKEQIKRHINQVVELETQEITQKDKVYLDLEREIEIVEDKLQNMSSLPRESEQIKITIREISEKIKTSTINYNQKEQLLKLRNHLCEIRPGLFSGYEFLELIPIRNSAPAVPVKLESTTFNDQDESLAYEVQMLEIRKELCGHKHPVVASSLNDIGLTLGAWGRHEEALEYKLQALEIRRDLYGDVHSSTAISLNNVGLTLESLSKNKESLIYKLQAKINKNELIGKNNLESSTILVDLGYAFEDLDKHNEALTYQMQALKIRKVILGDDHPLVALSLNNVGFSLDCLGRHDEALNYHIQALQMKGKILGIDYSLVALSLNNMGMVYKSMGETSRALGCFKQAVSIVQTVFLSSTSFRIKKYIDNLEVIKKDANEKSKQLVLKACDLQKKGDFQAASKLYKEAFTILLELHDEKLPLLSDSFLSLQIVQQIPIFKICGKYKDLQSTI